jgi:hypothetical protein
MGKRVARWARPDIKTILGNLNVSDEAVRGDAVRYLCPCHAGWELFEEHVGVLHRLLKDPSDVVRRHALHVFEDAARMQSRGDLEYCVEADEEKIGEKRTSCYRSMEQRFEARRARKISKRKSLRLRSI